NENSHAIFYYFLVIYSSDSVLLCCITYPFFIKFQYEFCLCRITSSSVFTFALFVQIHLATSMLDSVIPPEFLLQLSWYFGEISRERANEILLNQPAGTYLIRDSTTLPGFALSLKYNAIFTLKKLSRNINRVQRYFIAYSEEAKTFTFAEQPFESIDALISFHSTSPLLTCKLLQPAPKGYYCVLYDYKGKVSIHFKKEWIFCSSSDGRRGWVFVYLVAFQYVCLTRSTRGINSIINFRSFFKHLNSNSVDFYSPAYQ
ncbi:unnamed protein product, partial [Schistocephalus solidus]|uniref:SH2 domain-containing protein n=1 Tax=Schistocephalus solidus TaxID=70667 RepID=A0A183SB99_SCHSO